MAYGTVNADVIGTSVAGSNLGAGNASIMKNRIINGAMIVNQRNASITSTGYSVDRFKYTGSQASKGTVAQSTTAPAGFINSLQFTSSSAYSVAAGDFFFLSQVIEGYNISDLAWGTANAKTITLSFQVYSSLTGTFGGVLTNGANNRTYPFSYTVSSANTWTPISITIAGDTTGTWATDNTAGIFVLFSLGSGSTYSGAAGSWSGNTYYGTTGTTSVVGTNGATFYITGVQLEVGSIATGFEYRMYQQELALCQRYYSKNIQLSGSYTQFAIGYGQNTTDCWAYVKYPVSMRSSPTVTYNDILVGNNAISPSVTSIGSLGCGTDSIRIAFVTSGLTAGTFYMVCGNVSSTASYVALSAEL
jgi:hypothetical protein